MALDMKAEELNTDPKKLLGLFGATDDPRKLTQKAPRSPVLTGGLGRDPRHPGAFFLFLFPGAFSTNTSKPIK